MAKFKVTYRNRNRLASVLRRIIRSEGLIDQGSLVDSVRISFEQDGELKEGVTPRRNELVLRMTINAMYYYLFLDEGATLANGGIIAPFNITTRFMNDSQTQEVLQEVTKDFVLFIYEVTDKILQIPNPTIELYLNPIGGQGSGTDLREGDFVRLSF